MAARGDSVKCNFTDLMLSTTRLVSNVSKMFPLCYCHMFYPIEIICLPYYEKKKTVLINFDILLTQHLSTLQHIITAKPLDISSSGYTAVFI